MRLDKVLDTTRAKVKKLCAILMLLFISDAEFALGKIEFALA